MKRWQTISLFGSSLDNYKDPLTKNGPYIVDDSNFIPMSETIKQLSKTAPLDKGVIEGVYDFPNGLDDGRKVPIARLRPEIVELSEEVRKQNKEIRKEVAKAEKIARDNEIMASFKPKGVQTQGTE